MSDAQPRRLRSLNRFRWQVVELVGELRYSKTWWQRKFAWRSFMCNVGAHWPIRWSDSAYPGSYDPPEPPEAGFCCHWCGKAREPYRAWLWDHPRFVPSFILRKGWL